jgi:hypothetical protein
MLQEGADRQLWIVGAEGSGSLNEACLDGSRVCADGSLDDLGRYVWPVSFESSE